MFTNKSAAISMPSMTTNRNVVVHQNIGLFRDLNNNNSDHMTNSGYLHIQIQLFFSWQEAFRTTATFTKSPAARDTFGDCHDLSNR